MNFKEFFNKADSMPLSNTIGIPKITGMTVTKDYQKYQPQNFFTLPKTVVRHKPAMPSTPMLPYRRPLSQRPIESKPTDFLARKTPSKNK